MDQHCSGRPAGLKDTSYLGGIHGGHNITAVNIERTGSVMVERFSERSMVIENHVSAEKKAKKGK